jgi:hypothetical protein
MKSRSGYEFAPAAFAVIVCAILGLCPEASRADVDPQTYTSPSGTYALFVNPADRFGTHSASYQFTKGGEAIWSGERPYTLREVVVTDDGISAGWALRTGPKDASTPRRCLRHGTTLNPPSYLHIVILDATGRELLNDVTERVERGSPLLRESRQPLVRHFLVDPDNDRLMVWVKERDANWWVYKLLTGRLVGRLNLADRKLDFFKKRTLVDARLLPGSPFVLLHWCGKDDEGWGARFSLLDADFATIWSLDAKNDYKHMTLWPGGLFGYFQDYPAILSVEPQGRFTIRLFSAHKKVSFAFAPVGGPRCVVREVERTDFPEPPVDPPNGQ